MGIDAMAEVLQPFGLGQRTGIDIPGEQDGILPNTDWKRAALGEPWYPGETISAGIGQGYMLTTPLQLAQAAMVLANKGESFVPSVVHRVDDLTVGGVQRPSIPMDEADWQAVVVGMVDVVHSPRGTAAGIARGIGYQIAGKTGTTQVVNIARTRFTTKTPSANATATTGCLSRLRRLKIRALWSRLSLKTVGAVVRRHRSPSESWMPG